MIHEVNIENQTQPRVNESELSFLYVHENEREILPNEIHVGTMVRNLFSAELLSRTELQLRNVQSQPDCRPEIRQYARTRGRQPESPEKLKI